MPITHLSEVLSITFCMCPTPEKAALASAGLLPEKIPKEEITNGLVYQNFLVMRIMCFAFA